MTEIKIPRTCIACNKKRRTTVQPEERKVYICEYCLRGDIYDTAVAGLTGKKRWIISAIFIASVFAVGYIIGKL